MASVLVTGAAGYIGSHLVFALLEHGYDVVAVDNLSTGSRALVSAEATFVEGDAGDFLLMRRVIEAHDIEAVVHMAGSVVVPESVAQPLSYYANNTVVSRALIEAAIASGVKKFIFSSTATVYDERAGQPLSEDSPKGPISPYARSKLMTEWMLESASAAHDFRYMVLRYFNVAGADPLGRTGQSAPNATHLIKRASQVALGLRSHLDVFGTDYPTPDGTGVRDYIHVSDLVSAHLLALAALGSDAPSTAFNCGYGRGVSVREVVSAMERVSGRRLPVREGPRRPGDPPMLVADSSRIVRTLNWRPLHNDLDEIVCSALAWEKKLVAQRDNAAA